MVVIPQTRTAIIVIAYHGRRWIKDCVTSIDATMERREHLYVVDNSGNEGCIPSDVAHCRYTILKTPHPMGFAEANNFAVQNLVEPVDYVCFLNQDTLCRPEWLEQCVEVMDEDGAIGAVTPTLFSFGWNEFNPNFLACASANQVLTDDLNAENRLHRFYDVPHIPAAAMIVRSAVLWETGPFDSIFGSYYEDFDLCRRVREAGYRVGVCGQAQVAHYDSVTDENLADIRTRRRHKLILRNRAILKTRNAGSQRLSAFLSCTCIDLPRQVVRSLLRRPGRKSIRSSLGAIGSLLKLAPRLLRRSVDEQKWNEELKSFQDHFQCREAGSAVPAGTVTE